jgi:hypothetical protein
MGWGVLDYPSAPRELPYWICDDCSDHVHDEGEVTDGCHACWKTCLCLGCAFDCADCDHVFCRKHILEEPGTIPGFSTYRCHKCAEKRAQEAA